MEKNKGINKGHSNLKPCKPGHTANPNGRPKGQLNYSTIYRNALIQLGKMNGKTAEEIEMEMHSKAILKARGGDFQFYKDINDRIHGKAQDKLDVTSAGKALPTPIYGGRAK